MREPEFSEIAAYSSILGRFRQTRHSEPLYKLEPNFLGTGQSPVQAKSTNFINTKTRGFELETFSDGFQLTNDRKEFSPLHLQFLF